MGDLNQLDFVIENRRMVVGPILEVGSKNYGNTNDFRSIFQNETYVGVDLEPGEGVDAVCDFTSGYEVLRQRVGFEKFATVICFSVLEHCNNPFKMAGNITAFLPQGGVLFLSVPFVWNIHSYPSDYWRFTPASIPVLFPDLTLLRGKSFYSTKVRGEKLPLDADLVRFRPVGIGYPYLLFPVMVNAVLMKEARLALRPTSSLMI